MRMKEKIAITLVAISILVFGGEVGVGEGKFEFHSLDLESQVKLLNKPAIKSIQDADGGTIDCINIYQQPAFDHHLLKNHKIQMKPNAIPKNSIGKENDLSMKGPSSVLKKVECPHGSVPIPRTSKQQLSAAKHTSTLMHNPQATNSGRYHFATVATAPTPYRKYYGVRGKINIRKPKVWNNQSSAATIWIKNGPANELNAIQIGWMVSSTLFGDVSPRIYSYWTADSSKKTGCFNFLCPGFIQVSSTIVFGRELHNGRYGWPLQYDIEPIVFKDPRSGNWWLAFDGNDEKILSIGYWPNSIFTHLKEFATSLEFGGRVHGNLREAAPKMGSGHVKLVDYTRTCYISAIYVIVDLSNKFVEPKDINMLANGDSCYLAKYVGFYKGLYYSMMFGGPIHKHCII